MLKNVDPILSGELLLMLDQMGHGDEVAIVDRNFPSHAHHHRIAHARAEGIVPVVSAVLTVLPLDTSLISSLAQMSESRDKGVQPTVTQREVLAAVRDAGYPDHEFAKLDRFEFYERASKAFGIIATAEASPYCNFIFTKGVV